jgi:hypothetical protein
MGSRVNAAAAAEPPAGYGFRLTALAAAYTQSVAAWPHVEELTSHTLLAWPPLLTGFFVANLIIGSFMHRAFDQTLTKFEVDIALGAIGLFQLAERPFSEMALQYLSEIAECTMLDKLVLIALPVLVTNLVGWFIKKTQEPRYYERALKPSLTCVTWITSFTWEILGATAPALAKSVVVRRLFGLRIVTPTDVAAGVATTIAEETVMAPGWAATTCWRIFNWVLPMGSALWGIASSAKGWLSTAK